MFGLGPVGLEPPVRAKIIKKTKKSKRGGGICASRAPHGKVPFHLKLLLKLWLLVLLAAR